MVIVQIGNAPATDVVEQCCLCGVVRHVTQSHAPSGSSAAVRYFRKGLPALPNEECP